jgi:putative Ca2+/H+ antiporter (TMEM165/GDT1 family)
MDWKTFAAVFSTVFVAELGDKTQLATLLFAAETPAARWSVFLGAAAALTVAAALGVVAGAWIGAHVNPRYLRILAGIGFVAIGVWTLRSAYAG